MDELKHILLHSQMITLFVFVMMVLVDYINVLTRGKMSSVIKGSQGRQYVIASFLGATPVRKGEKMRPNDLTRAVPEQHQRTFLTTVYTSETTKYSGTPKRASRKNTASSPPRRLPRKSPQP